MDILISKKKEHHNYEKIQINFKLTLKFTVYKNFLDLKINF